MSRAEGQPIESQSLKPKEHKPKKVGRIACYLASLTIAGFGFTLFAEPSDNSAYTEFIKEHQDVSWAQGIESDFSVEINRALLENDSQKLEALKERIPIVSSALTTLNDFEGQIPPVSNDKTGTGLLLILLSMTLAAGTTVISHEYDEYLKKEKRQSVKE